MDKKIYETDNEEILSLTIDQSMSFRESIMHFGNSTGFDFDIDGNIDFADHRVDCLAKSISLEGGIEMGYFKFKLNREIKIINKECPERQMIALTFNFGVPLEDKSAEKGYITTQGIANSIYINNTKITTRVKVAKGSQVHMLTIRYPKAFLNEHFSMAHLFVDEVVENKGSVIVYVDFNEAIIQTLRGMELTKIPELTRQPFLLGKSLELMALFVDIFEHRSKHQSFNFNADEFDRLIRAKNFIVRDWKNPPTIQQVSDFLGMSPTKAKGLFRQTFGKPIYTYFKEKRMAEALRLINEGAWTISEIGHHLGYKNLGHFAESFYKQYGILPKKLSKSIQSGTTSKNNDLSS